MDEGLRHGRGGEVRHRESWGGRGSAQLLLVAICSGELWVGRDSVLVVEELWFILTTTLCCPSTDPCARGEERVFHIRVCCVNAAVRPLSEVLSYLCLCGSSTGEQGVNGAS